MYYSHWHCYHNCAVVEFRQSIRTMIKEEIEMKLYVKSTNSRKSTKSQVNSKAKQNYAERFANKVIRERKRLMDRLAES